MMSTMFRKQFAGHKTEIVGDSAGTSHKIVVPVPVKVSPAKFYEVTCQAKDWPEVSFLPLDGPTTKRLAIESACDRYRKVFELAPGDHINITLDTPAIGASLPGKTKENA